MRDFPRAPKTDPDSDFSEPAISTLPGLDGRNEREHQRRDQANAGAEHQHAPIDLALQVRDNAGRGGKEDDQQVAAPVGDRQSADCGNRRQDQAFGEQLLQQASVTGADGEADGHLVLARERAHHEQVAYV